MMMIALQLMMKRSKKKKMKKNICNMIALQRPNRLPLLVAVGVGDGDGDATLGVHFSFVLFWISSASFNTIFELEFQASRTSTSALFMYSVHCVSVSVYVCESECASPSPCNVNHFRNIEINTETTRQMQRMQMKWHVFYPNAFSSWRRFIRWPSTTCTLHARLIFTFSLYFIFIFQLYVLCAQFFFFALSFSMYCVSWMESFFDARHLLYSHKIVGTFYI